MACLTSLPAELVAHIGELTDPRCHLDLACTCSFIANALSGVLKRHQVAFANRSCSDLSELAIPKLLRSVIADPIAAYHQRTLIIWCARSDWSQWRPVRLQSPSDTSEDRFEPQETPSAWSFHSDEVESYLEILGRHVVDFREGSELREKARDELAKGDDGILKALLIILCPRLQTVYYARNSYVVTEKEEDVGNNSLAWLCRMIVSHRDQDISLWPPGLQSLRHLGVGVETGTWLDNGIPHICHPTFMAKLVSLPNLESIYVYGPGHRDRFAHHNEHAPLASYIPTPGCSSVRHIYMEEMEDFGTTYWKQILSASKSQLTSVTINGGDLADLDIYAGMAAQDPPNMQSLQIYGHQDSDLRGYRCTLYSPRETLSQSQHLRMITLSADDVSTESYREDERASETCRQDLIDYMIGCEGRVDGHDAAFPYALEVLVLTGGALDFFFMHARANPRIDWDTAAEYLDDALVALIGNAGVRDYSCESKVKNEEESKESELDVFNQDGPPEKTSPAGQRQANDENSDHQQQQSDDRAEHSESDEDYDDSGYHYPYLKTIYIEPWEEVALREGRPQSTKKLWLQKSIKAGIEHGVDVRTRTNVNPPLHSNPQLHMAPDRFDMRPDIAPPENCIFDPMKGKWVDRGCGNCGDCDACFALFPKELWAQAYRAPPKPAVEDDDVLVNGGELQTEIWTRFMRPISDDPNIGTMTPAIHKQQLEEYAKDRRCAGEDVDAYFECHFPPVGFPETARQAHYARALRAG